MAQWLTLLVAVTALGQDNARFRADVRQVRLDVRVALPDGSGATGLTKSDLVVLDEGQPRPITHFAFDSEPLDIVLLFDTSGSMKSHTAAVATAGRTALAALKEGDRVAVMAFDDKPRLFESFLSARQDIAATLGNLVEEEPFVGGTVINSGIRRAAEYLARRGRPRSRRTVVIFTDNVGQKGVTDEAVVDSLEQAEATLNVMLYQWKERSARRGSADATLIADRTGGEAMRVERAESNFREMLERLRQRYSIHYTVPEGAEPGSRRSVQVVLAPVAADRLSGATVQCRRSYQVPGAEVESSERERE